MLERNKKDMKNKKLEVFNPEHTRLYSNSGNDDDDEKGLRGNGGGKKESTVKRPDLMISGYFVISFVQRRMDTIRFWSSRPRTCRRMVLVWWVACGIGIMWQSG